MARENLILICASLIVAQLVIVSTDDIDWSTMHDELRKLGAPIRKKCVAEVGVALETLDKVELGEFPTDDKKLACYFKCVMEKGGVLKKDGKINTKLMTKMLPQQVKHIGQEMLNECKTIEGANNCEIGFNFNKCMYQANPVAYFVI
ncbi:general odorant-binding protein 56a [Linepithema humile]|uniref:general odorant-binding protein 56a n=1 Tax=Linepithema humile TaxID=83485 RepID=UPI00351E26FA